MAFKVMMRGNSDARFYFIAWILNFSGAGIYVLTTTGYIPFNFISSHAAIIGMLCQLVLISFALTDQRTLTQREAEEVISKRLSGNQE